MIDETATTILTSLGEIPIFKRLFENDFVKRRFQRLENFFSRITRRITKKTLKPTTRKLTSLNWVLLNAAIFSYFAGVAQATNLTALEMVYQNYWLIGKYTLIVNLIGLIIKGFGYIIKVILKFLLILIGAFLAVMLFLKLLDWLISLFYPKSSATEPLTKKASLIAVEPDIVGDAHIGLEEKE